MLRLAAQRGLLLAGRHMCRRAFAASSAPKPTTSVLTTLAKVRESRPLKDAAKFYGDGANIVAAAAVNADMSIDNPLPRGVSMWSYHDLERHVRALANGLVEIGLTRGQKIAVLLPPGSQEYLTTLLSAADLGVTVVGLDPPSNPSAVNISELRATLEKYKPEAFVLWHGYKTSEAEDSLFSTGINSIINALAPSVAIDDARGTSGFTRITGRQSSYPNFPHLKWVIHTGDAHIRGAITFKSLLVYNDAPISSKSSGENTVLIEANTGRMLTAEGLFQEAKKLGKHLKLSSDPYTKAGKLVVSPEVSTEAAAACWSALMHETILISPSYSGDAERSAKAAEVENALLA